MRRITVATGKGPPARYDYQRPVIYMTHRRRLDAYLLDRAEEAGAEVLRGYRAVAVSEDERQVTVTCRLDAEGRTEQVQGQYAVGADGVFSVIGKSFKMGLPHDDYCFAVACDIAVNGTLAREFAGRAHFDFNPAYGGYAWIFPKGDILSCGVGLPGRQAPHIHRGFAEFIRVSGLSGAQPCGALKGALIPRGTAIERYHTGRCLLVGDAAGLADPMSGEGIQYALCTGRWAAEAVGGALAGDTEKLAGYTQRLHETLVPELRAARNICDIFFRLPASYARTVLRTQRALRALGALMSGERSYQSLLEGVRRRLSFGILRS